MSEPTKPERPTEDDGSTAPGEAGGTTDSATTASAPPASVEPASAPDAHSDTGTDENLDEAGDEEEVAYRQELRKGLLLGVGGGVLAGLIVSLVLGALVWPGWLTGPGSPDDAAVRASSALASKDPAALDAVSCKDPEGRPTTVLPPQALQVIQSATSAGPARKTLDGEARAPVDLVLSAQGQTETLPSDLVLGVSDGDWCMNGLAERS